MVRRVRRLEREVRTLFVIPVLVVVRMRMPGTVMGVVVMREWQV
jgi:hypothetical protein